MKFLVEVDEEVGVDMDVVVVAAVFTVTLPMMKIHLLLLELLLVKVLLKKGKMGSPQKDVVMVDHVVLTEVVVIMASTMEKMVKRDVHEECLNAAVGLDAGY